MLKLVRVAADDVVVRAEDDRTELFLWTIPPR
jgi:hypothetical protein